jgi:signal transduction histidine kinase
VLTFLIAAFLGDVIDSAASRWTEPVLGPSLAPNALGTAWVEAITLCVIGIIVAAFRQHRTEVSGLLLAQERLLVTRQDAERALAQESQQVIDALRTSVTATLVGLSAKDPVQCSQDLRVAAEEVVRPLSHELATQEADFAPASLAVARPAPWSAVLAQVPTTPLIAPTVMAVVMTLLASRLTVQAGVRRPAPTAAATTIGPLTLSVDLRPLLEAVLALVAVFVSTWLAAAVVRRLSRPLLARSSLGRRWSVALVGVVLIGALSQALIGMAFLLPGFPPLPEITPMVNVLLLIPLLLIALAVGAIRAIALRQQNLRAEIAQANSDLAWEVARANEALWQQRRRLAQSVHGPLQAALNAGAITVDAADRQGTLTDQVIDRVRLEVQSALDQVNVQGEQAADPAWAISQAQRLWSEVCHIEVDVPSHVYDALLQDPVSASIFVEVINEACANAVIHGHASQINVCARVADTRSLDITVSDNGRLDGDPVQIEVEGLGSRFLDDVAVNWSRQASPSGTTLSVRLPARVIPELTR